ncbi:MAG: YigZ family protein [Clostridia bacterium]|nr:YigZ family protein [Clostridia bacterium]
MNNENHVEKITIDTPVEAETIEKKSRFIANLAPSKNEKDAKEHIDRIKSRFPDATHNVYAYYIDRGTYARYSDDGEPQGTAGLPVLNALKMSGLTDICVVVTRYFGGILLGAGGLVRAYSNAARSAIQLCKKVVYKPYTITTTSIGYSEYQKISKIIEPFGGVIEKSTFGQNVSLVISVPDDSLDRLHSVVRDLSSGSSEINVISKEERPELIK